MQCNATQSNAEQSKVRWSITGAKIKLLFKNEIRCFLTHMRDLGARPGANDSYGRGGIFNKKIQNLKIQLNPTILLFPAIAGYFRLLPAISGYFRLFPAISGYFRLFSGYFPLYLQNCGMEGLIPALAIGH